MYTDAEQLIAEGKEGKWVKASDEERAAVVRSIAGANMVRGSKNQPSLRHYEREGHIVVHSRGVEAEAHPADKS